MAVGERSHVSEEPIVTTEVQVVPAAPQVSEVDAIHPVCSSTEIQNGVRGIEAISLTWTGWSLFIAYGSVMLMAFVMSLEVQVTSSLLPFVTSSFRRHSLVSTIAVVQGVMNAVIKPPMAKVADVFGRLEAFSLSIGLFVLGYIQMSASNNVETFASAQVFYSAGSTGLLILIQIFIADTSDLSNRALFSTLPDLPYLVTTWIGAIIGNGVYRSSGSWRWAYGMWTILLPVAFFPLGFSLFLNGRRARQMGLSPQTLASFRGKPLTVLLKLWIELDIGGIIILSAGLALILIPCTIAGTIPNGWENGSIIAMITIGATLLVIFPFWEASTQYARRRGLEGSVGNVLSNLAPYPLIPLHLLKSRTFSAGSLLAIFYFMAFYLSIQPYFHSYLLVVRNLSIQSATYIVNIFSLSATVSSLIVSLLIKVTNRYKWFVTAGSCLYMLGMGLMMRYRAEDTPLSAIIGIQVFIGFGGGMLNVPTQLGIQASAGHQHVGTATAIFLTLISVGAAIGAAISGALWGRLIPSKLHTYLPEEVRGRAKTIFDDIEEALAYEVGSPERQAINRSYQETMTMLLTIAVCVCAPVIICSLFMTDFRLNKIEQGVKGRVVGGVVDEQEQKLGDRRPHLRKAMDWMRGRRT